MKKLLMLGVALACATVLIGCGNSHEKVVSQMYLAIGSGDKEEMQTFAEANFAPGLGDALKYNKDTKKVFKKISESTGLGFAKTAVLKTFKKDGSKFSVISARCEGTELFFVVGGKDDKIMFITADKSEVMKSVADEDIPGNTQKTEKLSKSQKVNAPSSQGAVQHKKLSKKEETEMLLAQLRKYCKDNGAEAVMPSIETMLAMTDEKDRPKMLRKTLHEMSIKPCVPEASCEDTGGNLPVSRSLTTSRPTSQAVKCTETKCSASERLPPEQKVARLMAQLKKVLGDSGRVAVALASIQEKADQVPGDYKTKCVLQEMFGLQNKIPGGVIPDLPDTNGNNALADYLKARDIGDVGTIMCMYHCLSDEEQASVAEEVRKMMK